MMHTKVLCLLAFAVALTALPHPGAAEITPAVKQACRSDYKKFCAVYKLQDPGLRQCMNKAGHGLSKGCVDALVGAGEVSKQRAARWRQR
jgi:hypothetical protein